MLNYQYHFDLNKYQTLIIILSKHIIFAFILSSFALFSQDYLWPLKAGQNLTAVFGEERPGRYHTGIDIRTFGQIGYPLVAVYDGYISRIRTSSKKYGKTLYLKLNDGNTAVYAHLDHFIPELDNLASALQEYYDQYEIDHFFEKKEHIIKKGDLIGYSGDTGGVSGPHLHFEIRDQNQNPVNPFNYGLSISDDIPPTVNSLAFIPLNRKSYINGYPEEKLFSLKKINESEYVLEDTISTIGPFGMAIKTSDSISNQEFSFGIYSINLHHNNNLIYSMQYDKIKWNESKSLYTEKSYSLARKGFGKFYHLFSHQNNQTLTFINSQSYSNITIHEPGLHNAIITINDYIGNQAKVKVTFYSDSIPKYNYNVTFSNDTCSIHFITNNKLKPYFYRINRHDYSIKNISKYYDMGNNHFFITGIQNPDNIIEIYAKNQHGLRSQSTFHMSNKKNYKEIDGELYIKHYEHGILIKFEEDMFSGKNAFITLEKKGIEYPFELNKESLLTYSSNILSPVELENVSKIKVYYKDTTAEEIFNMDQDGAIILPDSAFNFSFLDNQIIINGLENTFYDTVYFWAQYADAMKPENGSVVSNIFKLFPDLIPFNKEINLNIAINKHRYPKYLSIYYYNENNQSWHFMPSTYNSDSTYMQTQILSGEVFAIIQEETSPILSSFIPQLNGTYYSSDLEHISFHLYDSFSGIDDEKDVYVELDGKRIIFEYNSYQKKVRYPLKYNLKEGEHTLFVKVQDRVGNKSIIDGKFFIKESK